MRYHTFPWYLTFFNFIVLIEQRALHPSSQKETVSASDEDAIADVMEQHDQFLASMQSHLLKLQVSY